MKNKSNQYIQKEQYLELHIYSSKHGEFVILLDSDDYHKVKDIHWGIEFDGNNWYVRNRCSNIRLHRYITDCPKGMVVDHINRNTLDNRKKNLRVCTSSENNRNRPVVVNYPHSTNEYGIGIWTCKCKNKIYTYFKVQMQGYKIKTFKTIEKAIEYRDYLLHIKIINDKEKTQTCAQILTGI